MGSYRYRSLIEGLYIYIYIHLIEALYTLNSPPVVFIKRFEVFSNQKYRFYLGSITSALKFDERQREGPKHMEIPLAVLSGCVEGDVLPPCNVQGFSLSFGNCCLKLHCYAEMVRSCFTPIILAGQKRVH